MVDCPITVVDRGTITADTNAILDGFVTATASDPNPDLHRGEGVVYNLVLDHPEVEGSHGRALQGEAVGGDAGLGALGDEAGGVGARAEGRADPGELAAARPAGA